MAYTKDEAPIVISKDIRDMLQTVANNNRRTMKAQVEMLIEEAYKKPIKKP